VIDRQTDTGRHFITLSTEVGGMIITQHNKKPKHLNVTEAQN